MGQEASDKYVHVGDRHYVTNYNDEFDSTDQKLFMSPDLDESMATFDETGTLDMDDITEGPNQL